MQVIEMTVNEQITMYMKCSKKELCKMLIEANRHLKNLPIHVVGRTLVCDHPEDQRVWRRVGNYSYCDKCKELVKAN